MYCANVIYWTVNTLTGSSSEFKSCIAIGVNAHSSRKYRLSQRTRVNIVRNFESGSRIHWRSEEVLIVLHLIGPISGPDYFQESKNRSVNPIGSSLSPP